MSFLSSRHRSAKGVCGCEDGRCPVMTVLRSPAVSVSVADVSPLYWECVSTGYGRAGRREDRWGCGTRDPGVSKDVTLDVGETGRRQVSGGGRRSGPLASPNRPFSVNARTRAKVISRPRGRPARTGRGRAALALSLARRRRYRAASGIEVTCLRCRLGRPSLNRPRPRP